MTRIAIATIATATIGLALAGCYDLPEPDCGFVCGSGGACPADYTCAADDVCHRNGTPATLVCVTPDAAIDAAIDAPPDVAIDAPP